MEITQKPRFVCPEQPPHAGGRLGVIDIGSSMVRLVVYDDGIYPHLYLNHKVWTLLAKDKGDGDFFLKEDAIARTLSALEWFLWVCEGAGVTRVIATATSAVREAQNGDAFVQQAYEKTGLHVEVISGEQEARLSALGACVSLPDASGVVVDLGGGSLDLCETAKGGEFCSLPLGVLSLRCLSEDSPTVSVGLLQSRLSEVPWFTSSQGGDLVALGAGMRSIASLYIERTGYAMNILHDFEINAVDAQAFCDEILSGGVLDKAENITQEFKDVIPYRAAVLKALLSSGNFSRVRFASFGLREGLLFSEYGGEALGKDPLLTFAEDMAERDGHGAVTAYAMANWVHGYIPTVSPRLLQAASLFAHVAWREQYTYRATATFEITYGAPYVACSHKERAMISLMAYFAHTETVFEDIAKRVDGILTIEDIRQARKVGVLMSIAMMIDPGFRGHLEAFSIKEAGGALSLVGPEPFMHMQSESIQKRLDVLAAM